MLGSRSTYTRARILEAAERLFAIKGHENTSLREITAEAKVNLASVNYHFGSKEGLIQAVCQQQLDSLNQARLAALDLLEAQAAGSPVEPERLIEAFFRPLLQHVLERTETNTSAMLPMEQPPSKQKGFPRALLASHPTSATDRFLAALEKTLPDMPRQEILWRYQFMLGACAAAIVSMDGLLIAPGWERTEAADLDELCQRLTAFLAGGLSAPSQTSALRPGLAPEPLDETNRHCSALRES